MRRMRLSDAAHAPVLIEEHVPQPQPGRGALLVRVYAAGVTPTELLWYPTTHAKNGERRGRAVPGHEFSGVIAAVGAETVGFDIGQAVYGMNDWFADGALAEYCITQPTCVAHKPPRLTHVEAASVPIGALTAWQGLFDRAQLQAGEHVLVASSSVSPSSDRSSSSSTISTGPTALPSISCATSSTSRPTPGSCCSGPIATSNSVPIIH